MTHARTSRIVRLVRWTRTLAHLAHAALILRFVYARADRQRRRAIYQGWSAKLLAILAVDARVAGPLPGARGPEQAMIAANHVSWIDVAAISSVCPTRFIAKSEIRDWPIVGWICERAGTLFIRRARRHDTVRINEMVHAALADGDCVGLFPEGTTTEGDRVLKFHSSLFEPAVANRARVHPVALRYEHLDGTLCRAAGFVGELTFAQSMGLIARQKAIVARVMFAEPIDCDGLTRREVARLAQERVATLLGLPPLDSAPRTLSGPPGAPP